MVLFADDYLNIIGDMVAPTKLNTLSPALVAIGCLYQGQRVIMSEINQKSSKKNKMSDGWKEKCNKGQDTALRFVEYLERLPEWEDVVKSTANSVKNVSESHEKLTNALFDIKLEIAGHSDTKKSLDKLLGAVTKLTDNVTRVCTNHDNYQKDLSRIETKQNNMDEAARTESKNSWIEIGKLRDKITVVDTRQTGILGVIGKIFPYLMLAVMAWWNYSTNSGP